MNLGCFLVLLLQLAGGFVVPSRRPLADRACPKVRLKAPGESICGDQNSRSWQDIIIITAPASCQSTLGGAATLRASADGLC